MSNSRNNEIDYSQPKSNSYIMEPDYSQPIGSKSSSKNDPLKGLQDVDQFLKSNKKASQPGIGDLLGLDPQIKKDLGLVTTMALPEVKVGSLLPSTIMRNLPQLSNGLRIARDITSNIGKVGGSAYLGSKIAGNNDEQNLNAGLIGGGIAGVTTPVSMALASLNPLTRLFAGGGLGALTGYGLSHFTGGTPYATGLGGLIGSLAGLRAPGAAQLAARNAADAMVPENAVNAIDRIPAANRVGIPLSMPEATGSPIHQEMFNQAAGSNAGSRVIYPWAMNRARAEENSYNNTLNDISPNNAPARINYLYTRAKDENPNVDIKPVIDHIDRAMESQPPGLIRDALTTTRNFLRPSPETMAEHNRILAPINAAEDKIQSQIRNIQEQIPKLEKESESSYFNYGSPDNKMKLQQANNGIQSLQQMLKEVQDQKALIMQQHGIGETSNKLRDLHIAQMNMNALGERTGASESSIGKTAAREVGRVQDILKQQLDQASPIYREARQLASRDFTRTEIENKMASSELSGSNFYDKVLLNRNEYDDLYHKLGDPNHPNRVSRAQQRLEDMRTALPDLMNNVTAKSGKSLAEQHPEAKFGIMDLAKGLLNKVYMNRYNRAVAELLINPRWQDELAQVARMRAGEDRGIALSRLFGKVAGTGSAAYSTTQGSEGYGTGQ